VELWSVTPATPSISRRRSIVSATADCDFAQPDTVKVGTLPGGVAELTGAEDAAEPLEPALAEEAEEAGLELAGLELAGLELAGLELAEELAGAAEEDADGAAPAAPVPVVVTMVPLSEEMDALEGSTRANSWNAWAQSKRESTSCATASTRALRSWMKFVYGTSAAVAACAFWARSASAAASFLSLEMWWLARPYISVMTAIAARSPSTA
jgi:hypothetical protein